MYGDNLWFNKIFIWEDYIFLQMFFNMTTETIETKYFILYYD